MSRPGGGSPTGASRPHAAQGPESSSALEGLDSIRSRSSAAASATERPCSSARSRRDAASSGCERSDSSPETAQAATSSAGIFPDEEVRRALHAADLAALPVGSNCRLGVRDARVARRRTVSRLLAARPVGDIQTLLEERVARRQTHRFAGVVIERVSGRREPERRNRRERIRGGVESLEQVGCDTRPQRRGLSRHQIGAQRGSVDQLQRPRSDPHPLVTPGGVERFAQPPQSHVRERARDVGEDLDASHARDSTRVAGSPYRAEVPIGRDLRPFSPSRVLLIVGV